MRIKNTTIAEYAHIPVKILSGIITGMLIADSLSITLTVGLIDGADLPLKQPAIALLLFATGSGVLLFFLAQRYLQSVTYRFGNIEDKQMEAIANVAKRFYLPFVMCLVSNIFLSLLGLTLLVVIIFS